MLNYILFSLIVFLTFFLAYFTLKAEKEKFQIIKYSKKIILSITVYSTILIFIILYSIFSGKIVNMLGIDFIGGTLTELSINNKNITNEQISEIYKKNNLEVTIQDVILQDSTNNQKIVVLKTKPLDELKKNQIIKELESIGEVRKTENISASIGSETLKKGIIALVIALIAQVIYISLRFGNNLLYGVIADIALLHDVIVMLGIYVILGMAGFAGFEINSTFLAAVLTVVGYSVMDTIIIFDRIRENLRIELKQNQKISLEKFDNIINNSVIQTLVRSVFTTLTVLLALWGLVFLGGESLRSFSIALAVGTFSGAFSSIFIAAPLLSIMKEKILKKDITSLTEEEQKQKVESLASSITQIFQHQQENDEEFTNTEDEVKEQKDKSITSKYLKPKIKIQKTKRLKLNKENTKEEE